MRNRSLGPVAALATFSLAFTAAADSHLASEAAPAPAAPAAEQPMPAMEEPMAAMEAPTAAEPATPAPPTGRVARARFALEVTEREPSDTVRRLSNDHDQIAFFTELQGFQGQELVHRWEFGGQLMAEVPFGVGGPRWRVHSSKNLDPARLGTWTVSVVDASGNVVEQQSFDYVAAEEPIASRAAEPALAPPPANADPMMDSAAPMADDPYRSSMPAPTTVE